MDFHTAVGFSAAEKVVAPESKTIIVSTASPIKFAKEMAEQTGIPVDNSQILKDLRMKKNRVVYVANDYALMRETLLEKLG